MARKILILTANPNDAAKLRADKEMQKIQERLRRAAQSNRFEIIFQCARPDTLLDVLEDEKPEIVHFCGHGTEQGLVLETESGDTSHLIRTEALKKLFKRVARYVRCVLLNACYSEIHAKAISEHIPYAIGMEGEILDKAAIAFASAFYKDLGDGQPIEAAFERGSLAAEIANRYEVIDEIPKLFKKHSPSVLDRIWQVISRVASAGIALVKGHRRQRMVALVGLACMVGVTVAVAFPRVMQVPIPGSQLSLADAPCGDSVAQLSTQPSESVNVIQEQGLMSSGTDILLSYKKNATLVKQATNAFGRAEQGDQNYGEAISLFQRAIGQDKANPEPYIYLNNALARQRSREQGVSPYVLAAVIPASSRAENNRAEEMLRGIADAQACFNDFNQSYCSHDPKGRLLEIKLVDDANNNNEIVPQIARAIAEDPDIVGVVGHYSSGATETGLLIYRQYGLPIISPTSTSSNLSDKIFFRTSPSTKTYSNKIVDFIQQRNVKRVVSFIDSSDTYSRDQWSAIEASLQAIGITVDKTVELSDSMAESVVDAVSSNDSYAFVLIPPSTRTPKFASETASFARVTQIAEKISQKRNHLFIGGSSLYSSKTLSLAGSAFNGMVLITPWFAKTSSDTEQFAERSAKTWGGQINWVTANSYDATQVFMSALSATEGTTNRDELRIRLLGAIESVNLPPKYTSGSPLQFSSSPALTLNPCHGILSRVSRTTPERDEEAPSRSLFGQV